MADGFEVDLDTLIDAARASAEIAGDAERLPDEFGIALGFIGNGASGSQSASVASAAAPGWADMLKQHFDRVQDIGERLRQTASEYLHQEQAAERALNRIEVDAANGVASDGRIAAILDGG
jgi:hypothetical protein